METRQRVERARALEEVIEGRRSVRRFTDAPLPEEDLLRLVRAAGLAPSAGNQQMWHFILVRNKGIMEEMRQAVIDACEEMLTWREAAEYEGRVRSIAGYSTFFADAPVTIGVLSKLYDSPMDAHIFPARGMSFEEIYRLRGDPGRQSLGAAVENLLLMAHALGYGACWMTGPLVACPALERALKVEEPWHLVALIALGVPDQSPSPRPRKALPEICTFID